MTSENPSCLRIAVTLPIKGTFTYAVPRHLKSRAVIGCRALVPFKNRKVIGYILEKQAETDQFKLKEILDVLDPAPLFPEQMVPFFEWMAKYYIHPIGSVIQSALPAGLNIKYYKTASLTEKGLSALDKLPAHYEESRLLAWIKENPNKKLPCPVSSIASFQKKGWLLVKNAVGKKPTGPLMRKFVRMKADVDAHAFFTENNGLLKAKNEVEFLERILSSSRVLLSDLSTEFKNASYLVNKWIKKGILEIVIDEVFRNPAGEMLSPSPVPVELHEQQALSVRYIRKMLDKRIFSACLLFGVTGSGKTEVYFRAVEHTLRSGRQAILMIPEIALAVFMLGLFRSRLGDRVATYHSGLSRGERYDQWVRIAGGDADLVIGARSALFVPLPRLGLIIVDEEHDPAYKQDSNPRYQARDSAVVRAKMENALVILGSGTPSVQSFHNSKIGRYHLLEMPERVENRPLPDVKIINMKLNEEARAKKDILSPELKKAIDRNLEEGHQTLLFLNRRGFHRLLICRSCGKPVTCPNCDVALTHHKNKEILVCHYCGYHSGINIKCPTCKYVRLRPYGFGTEKLEEDLEQYFPKARIARMDTDSTSRKGQAFKILKKFSNHEIDILVGTQMITKGYDFPMVTLVGVIAADLSLGFPDFRAGERTFQIISQVAGRAGRGALEGRVIVQTFNPDHYAIKFATSHDFHLFFEKEKSLREQLGYPPFSHLAFLRLNGASKEKTREAARHLARNIKGRLSKWPKMGKEFLVLGPVEAPLSKLKGKYRWQILIKCKSVSLLQHLLEEVETFSKKFLRASSVHLILDVDPYQMS